MLLFPNLTDQRECNNCSIYSGHPWKPCTLWYISPWFQTQRITVTIVITTIIIAAGMSIEVPYVGEKMFMSTGLTVISELLPNIIFQFVPGCVIEIIYMISYNVDLIKELLQTSGWRQTPRKQLTYLRGLCCEIHISYNKNDWVFLHHKVGQYLHQCKEKSQCELFLMDHNLNSV